jgi:disulfide oxidoreductase YuzD
MKYGNIIWTEYIDLADPEEAEQHKDVIEFMVGKRLRYPLVTLDGKYISCADIDDIRITRAIDQKLAAEQEPAEA